MASVAGSTSDRLRMALNREEGLKELDQVVLKYSRVEGKPWSFKDHEYQIEIIKDTRSRIDIRKCSQVGASEVLVQKTLAMSSVMQHIRIMYSLPTKEMAMGFSKDRFDGAIEQSPFYSGLVAAGGNSAGQKKIGTCMLYVIGTFGSKSAISVPAEIVLSDEVDFSNEVVLGKLNSRLRHANSVDERGNRGYRIRFSTPTVEGYGIDDGFNAGDQRYYMCRCEHCEHWVVPDYLHDFIVPGFTKSMLEFSAADARDDRFDKEAAWIKCPHCGKDLFSSLLQPARRQWVAKRPDVWDHSYQISPWDVPVYNTPPAIIKQFTDYPLRSDYFNFVLGLPYTDAENSFTVSKEHKDKHCCIDLWIYGTYIVTAPTVGGMDIGKTCHLTVGVQVGKYTHVVWMEKIVNTKSDPAAPKVLERYDFYGMRKLIIDAGPDITLVNLLVGARENIQACVYTTVSGIVPVAEAKDGDVINADRTKTLTLLLIAHNAGEMLYPHREDHKEELYQHLQTTKKIRERNADGEVTERFIKNKKEDHWVHSLNYLNIARLTLTMLGDTEAAAAPPMVGGVRVGSAATDHEEGEHRLTGLLGVSGGSAKSRDRRFKW